MTGYDFTNNRTTDFVTTRMGTEGQGGAIHSDSAVSITDATFDANQAENGGAIAVSSSGTLTLDVVHFADNQAVEDGGAVHLTGTLALQIDDGGLRDVLPSTFTRNHACRDGGAMAVVRGATEDVEVAHLRFGYTAGTTTGTGNFANSCPPPPTGSTLDLPGVPDWGTEDLGDGGGLFVIGRNLTLTDTHFHGGWAENGGGLAALMTGRASVDPWMTSNAARGDGGGGHIVAPTSVLLGAASVSGNHAENDGGGLFVLSNGGTTVDGSFSGNHADSLGTPTLSAFYAPDDGVGDGGALFIADGRDVVLQAVDFQRNSAQDGGALLVTGDTAVAGVVTATNNVARNDGGAMHLAGALTGVGGGTTGTQVLTLTNNHAANDGGGLFTTGTLTVVGDFTATGNHADSAPDVTGSVSDWTVATGGDAVGNGGGVYVDSAADVTLEGVSFTGNTAVEGGGMLVAGASPAAVGGLFDANQSVGLYPVTDDLRGESAAA